MALGEEEVQPETVGVQPLIVTEPSYTVICFYADGSSYILPNNVYQGASFTVENSTGIDYVRFRPVSSPDYYTDFYYNISVLLSSSWFSPSGSLPLCPSSVQCVFSGTLWDFHPLSLADYYAGTSSWQGSFKLDSVSNYYFIDVSFNDTFPEKLTLSAPICVLSPGSPPVDVDLEETNGLISGVISAVKNVLTAIIELPGKIVNLMVEGLKTLFIPSDDYFSTLFSDLQVWFDDRLGLLSAPLDFLLEFFGLFTGSPPDAELVLPAIEFGDIHVTDPYTFRFKDYPILTQLQVYCHFGTNVMLIGVVLHLLQTKWREVMTG